MLHYAAVSQVPLGLFSLLRLLLRDAYRGLRQLIFVVKVKEAKQRAHACPRCDGTAWYLREARRARPPRAHCA